MDKKTTGLSDNFKKNTAPKSFTKNPIKGTKYTIAISAPKEELVNQLLPQTLLWH